jgi:hypothetical protein
MNETKEKTCADRIADNLAGEEATLKEIYERLDGNSNEDRRGARGTL